MSIVCVVNKHINDRWEHLICTKGLFILFSPLRIFRLSVAAIAQFNAQGNARPRKIVIDAAISNGLVPKVIGP